MKNDNTKNDFFPTYSEDELGQYVFDGFEDYYVRIEEMMEDKGFLGIKDYRFIQELFIGTNVWEQHILQIRDNPSYKMTWHINEKEKDGRTFTQKVKRLCNNILINETMKYIYIIGTFVEEEIKKNVCRKMENSNFPDELRGEIEDTYYIQEYWDKRYDDLRILYWCPDSVYSLFTYLVEINGMEWLDLILNDAKMDYVELSRDWNKKDSDMLTYLDLCADRIKLMSNKMIPQKKIEYEGNEKLLRIFHGDKNNMQRFLKNIQGLSGAAIVHRVKAVIELQMIYEEDSQTPLYKALKELGYKVTTLQNWSDAFNSKKKVFLV